MLEGNTELCIDLVLISPQNAGCNLDAHESQPVHNSCLQLAYQDQARERYSM